MFAVTWRMKDAELVGAEAQKPNAALTPFKFSNWQFAHYGHPYKGAWQEASWTNFIHFAPRRGFPREKLICLSM